MKGFLRGILGGTILFAATAGPALANDPGARTTGAYSNGDTPSAGGSDTVTTNVRAALQGDKLLRGSVITVATAENGAVTLVGSVPSVTAKREAIELAQGTPGVLSVNDQLRLDISSPQAPARP
jgi:osmotically-inducible protein OsmY